MPDAEFRVPGSTVRQQYGVRARSVNGCGILMGGVVTAGGAGAFVGVAGAAVLAGLKV